MNILIGKAMILQTMKRNSCALDGKGYKSPSVAGHESRESDWCARICAVQSHRRKGESVGDIWCNDRGSTSRASFRSHAKPRAEYPTAAPIRLFSFPCATPNPTVGPCTDGHKGTDFYSSCTCIATTTCYEWLFSDWAIILHCARFIVQFFIVWIRCRSVPSPATSIKKWATLSTLTRAP